MIGEGLHPAEAGVGSEADQPGSFLIEDDATAATLQVDVAQGQDPVTRLPELVNRVFPGLELPADVAHLAGFVVAAIGPAPEAGDRGD